MVDLLLQKHLRIINLDITILAQAPKMAPYITKMRENLANDTYTNIQTINIKATTTEGMGFIGRKEGLAVHAVTLLG